MSSQRGNVKRTRPQKYKNTTAFKNDLHDTSSKIKKMNDIEIMNVCGKCKNILEWKIKFKKYKFVKAPKRCTKCEQKTVRCAYHIMCSQCAERLKVCPKCGNVEEIVRKTLPDLQKLDRELQNFVGGLPERKRRTFLRFISKKENRIGEVKDIEKIKEEALKKLTSLNLESEEEDSDAVNISDQPDSEE